jgi:hypothetical protein
MAEEDLGRNSVRADFLSPVNHRHFLICFHAPHGSRSRIVFMSTKPHSSSLTARSSRSGLQLQKPQSTSGFSKFRKALTIKPRGKRSKTRWRISVFSSGKVWVFPTGKRSSHAAVR